MLGSAVRTLYRGAGLTDFSREQIRYLSYGRGLDTTRMRTVLGLVPKFSTREAFLDFVHTRRLSGPLSPQVVHDAEQRLAGLIGVRPVRSTPVDGTSEDGVSTGKLASVDGSPAGLPSSSKGRDR